MGEGGVERASSDERNPVVDIIFKKANRLREEGNEAFRGGNYEEAVSIYTQCLDCITESRATLEGSRLLEDPAQGEREGSGISPRLKSEKHTFSSSAETPTAQPCRQTEALFQGKEGKKDKQNGALLATETGNPPLKQETTLQNTTTKCLDTLQAQVLCNRALCNNRLQRFALAEEDCTAALSLDPSNVKALYRRACAREGLERLTECMCDLQLLQQRGGCPGEAADIRKQQQMLGRVRETLLRQEQRKREQLQPQTLIAAALSAADDGHEKNVSAAERVLSVKKTTALVHTSSEMRRHFLRDGGLRRVSDYLANAPEVNPPRGETHVESGNKEEQKEDLVNTCKGKTVPESSILPPMTRALEAACWELLLRCVVDEGAEERQQQYEAATSVKTSLTSQCRSHTNAKCRKSGAASRKHGENMSHAQDAEADRGCLRFLRERWTSEQLLLRLRRLLHPATNRVILRKASFFEGDLGSCGSNENKQRVDLTKRADAPETEIGGRGGGGGGGTGAGGGNREFCEDDDRGVCGAAVARADRHCKEEEEKEEKKRDISSAPGGADNADKLEEEFFRMRASCSILRLMGQLEQMSAECFEDDTAFCTGCLLGMQCGSSIDVQVAAIDAASGVATARRTSAAHQAPVLALRHSIEKWLEELLQQYEASVQNNVMDSHHEKQLRRKKEGRREWHVLFNATELQSGDETCQEAHLQTQIECLLVTLLSLLVDKHRPLPPLFAAAQRSRDKGKEDAGCDEEQKHKTQRGKHQQATAEADTDRLLEQLLTPYLPLSMSMILGKREKGSSNRSTSKHVSILEESAYSSGMKKTDNEDAGTQDCTDSSSIDEDMSNRHDLASLLMWKGDDVQDAVVRQIVGLKILKLLLPAAREEISRFLMIDAYGVLRFAVAAAADDEGVRLTHTPRMLWLQQQAAAADLLILAMDFPELRQKLLHIGGLQALASSLSRCCNGLRTAQKHSSPLSVSAATALETAMSWVLCGKVAAVLARLAVHHENIRVEIFDFVNFYDVLSRLLQHWERHRQQQQYITVERSRSPSGEERVEEIASARGRDRGAAAPLALQADTMPSTVSRMVAEDEICQDFSQVFCFVSLHASFKQRLIADEGRMLPRLVRLVDAAFLIFAKNSNAAKGKASSNRNMILFLLLQGLSNLMRSRDDRRRRPRSSRGVNGSPQLDEEQQQQLEDFFSQLPAEAQPPRNGQVDAGDSEVANALKERLAECGVVGVLSGIIMSSMKAAATAAAQKEEEAEQYSVNSNSTAAAAAAAALQQQLSPNAMIAAIDVLSALSAPLVHRRTVVQEGGLRTLLAVIPFLHKDNSVYEAELRDARQAVARLCISANPSLLTYQETLEAITYVVPLLRDEHELLQYEAALAITNLTSSTVEAQNHAWHQGAWSALEDLLFSENPLLRAAGLEGWCNLAASHVVQDAIGSRCEELWQAECKSRIPALQDGATTRNTQRKSVMSVELTETQESTDTSNVAVVSTSQCEMQYIKILLAYCLETENMRARHAAVAALAMLVADCRTAAAVVRASNFTNLLRSLDDAELVKAEESGSEKGRYGGQTLILRIVATLNQLWAALKEADDKGGCNFQVLTEQIRKVLVRNKHKLTGVSSTLAEEVCAGT